MNDVTLSQVLSSVQFVEAPTGRRLTVMDADDWIGLIEWLEEIEDLQIVRANLARLQAGPEHRGLCSWRRSWMSYKVMLTVRKRPPYDYGDISALLQRVG